MEDVKPLIEGQEFPAHEHREYPKALYQGGESHDDTGRPAPSVIVNNAEEEAAAADDGFTAPKSGVADESPSEPSDEPLDADGDGHDDATGTFVAPNPGRRGKKK